MRNIVASLAAMLRILPTLAMLLFAWGAVAQPTVPQVAESAAAYRRTIESRTVATDAAQVLRAIRAAEAARKTAEIIELCEQLVALNSASFRAWLQLANAWRDADPLAEKGLSSAFNAYGAAGTAPDQLESLLMMSAFLRARLERHRKDYGEARTTLQKVELLLSYLAGDPGGTREGESFGLDPNDPAGSLQRLTQARTQATRQAEQALQEISAVASALDEIYRDIAAKVPSLSTDQMKAGDARSAPFGVVLEMGTPRPRVDFRIEGSDVRVCIAFTQELKSSGLSYRPFVEISAGDSSLSAFGVEVKGRDLCITGLDPGRTYQVRLLAGIPAKNDATLGEGVTIETVELPDLPQQIAFSGRHFILPASGSGEVPLFLTNVEDAELELYRITDRTLHRHIALRHIGGELPHKEYADLRERFAERLWSGTLRVAGGGDRKNKTIRTFLGVRALLDQRHQWLREQVATNPNQPLEISSPLLAVAMGADEQVRAEGRFYAGALKFEAAALDLPTPGVYALLTRDLAEPAAKRRANCQDNCGKFLVQWFLNTDIGLTFYEGDDDFTVVARSLRSGEAKTQTRIELVSAGNRVLAAGVTDENGVVKFGRSLTRGQQSNTLVAILAHHQNDFGFIVFTPERLDLSRLNVDGRPLTQGFNAFLTTDRGIYQPGESIQLLALMRDAKGIAPEQAPPVTVRLETRDRTVVERRLRPGEWSAGGALLPIEVPRSIRPGTARITLSVGRGEDAPIGETLVSIGPVRPDRARLTFVSQNSWRVRRTPNDTVNIEGRVSAQFLFADTPGQGGARNLKAEVVVKVAEAASPARDCYDQFSFGKFDDTLIPVSARHFVEYTDNAGNIDLNLSGIALPVGAKPVAATVEVTLFDAAGPLASRSTTFPIKDDKGWLGIAKQPRLRPDSKPGTFNLSVDLIALDAGNQPSGARNLEFRIERERDLYAWERRAGAWQHTRSARRETVVSGNLAAEGMKIAPSGARHADGSPCASALYAENVASDLEVGRYVVTVVDPQTGRETSIRYQTGAAMTDAEQLEPNIFTLSSDKQIYRPAEPIELTAEVGFDGEVLIAFADGDIRRWASGRARNGVAKIRVSAPADWAGKGMYALATVFRSGADGSASAGPGRAIGATHFEVRSEQTGYLVKVERLGTAAQGSIASNEELAFSACVADRSGNCSTNPPQVAFAAAFVVDEGLVNLTGHHDVVLDPERHFYGRKRFGLRVMDNYQRLLLKEGGDRPGRLALSNYTSSHIVSLASGPTRLENGRALFRLPKVDLQNGSASIMVVIWSRDYAAAKLDSVRVRNRVVADLDVPTFLHAGDRAILPLRLENIDFLHEGEFAIRVAASGSAARLATVDGGAPAGPTVDFRVGLRQGAPRTLYLALETPADAVGQVTLNVSLEAVGSTVSLSQPPNQWSLDLRSPLLPSVDTVSFPLRRQATDLGRLIDGIVSSGYDPDSVRVTARFSESARSLLSASVDRKGERPAPLLDQLVWRGLLLLHLDTPEDAAARREEIVRVLSELQSLQLPDGSFVPYRTLGDFSTSEVSFAQDQEGQATRGNALMRAASALDFMLLARNAGYDVPERTVRSARQFVEKRVNATPGDCQLDVLYGRLVLIALGRVEQDQLGGLDRCDYKDAAARAAGAAVASRFGLAAQAKTILAGFESSADVAELRKINDYRLAMMLAFLGEAGAPQPLMQSIAAVLLSPRNGVPISKAAAAWVMRGAKMLPDGGGRMTSADIQVEGLVGLRSRGGVLETAPMNYQQLRRSPVSIAVRGDVNARGFLTIEGLTRRLSDAKRLPAGALKRRLFDAETGRELRPTDAVHLGQRLVVVLEGGANAIPKVMGPDNEPIAGADGPLLVGDLLPSAFHIVAGSVLGQPGPTFPGLLGQLKPRGDLRSVETAPDRWVALIIPESQRARADPQSQGGDGDGAATPPPGAAGSGSSGEPEFRQGYLVRIGMAGRFTYPPTLIEPAAPPVRTLWGEPSRIEIALPRNEAR